MNRLVPCPACDGAGYISFWADRLDHICLYCDGSCVDPKSNPFDQCDDSGAQEHVVEPDLLAVFAEIGGAL